MRKGGRRRNRRRKVDAYKKLVVYEKYDNVALD
jgi:hypothetical protein